MKNQMHNKGTVQFLWAPAWTYIHLYNYIYHIAYFMYIYIFMHINLYHKGTLVPGTLATYIGPPDFQEDEYGWTFAIQSGIVTNHVPGWTFINFNWPFYWLRWYEVCEAAFKNNNRKGEWSAKWLLHTLSPPKIQGYCKASNSQASPTTVQ